MSSANHEPQIQYDIRVDGVTCPFCVATSERELKKIDGVSAVGADLSAGVISVCARPDVELTHDGLKRLFRKKGFTFRSVEQKAGCHVSDDAEEHLEHHHHVGHSP